MTRIIPTLLFAFLFVTAAILAKGVTEIDFPSFKDAPEIGFTLEISPYAAHDFEFGDFNNDGQLDIVNYNGKDVKYLSFRTLNNQVIREEPLVYPVNGMKTVDINQDKYPELVYYSLKGFNSFINIYFIAEDSTITIPVAEGTDVYPNGSWDSRMMNAKLLKKSTGELLLVFSLSTGRDHLPRGIYALNLHNFEMEWEFRLGGLLLHGLLIHDINRDEKQEILFTTDAPVNHVTQNGYADSTSYFFILDENGRELWHFPYYDGISYCFFRYQPQLNNVLIFGYTKDSKKDPSPVYQVSLSDFTLKRKIESEDRKIDDEYVNEHITSSNTNTIINRKELFSLRSNLGYLRIFNENLQETHELNFHHRARYAFNSDINGDQKNEWIVILKLGSEDLCKAIILDGKFRIIGYKDLPEIVRINLDPDSLKKETKIFFQNYNTKKIQAWVIPWGEIISPSSALYYWKKSRGAVPYFLATVFILVILGILLQNIRTQSFRSQKLSRIASYFLNNPVDAYLIIDESGIVEQYSPAFATLLHLPSQHLRNVRFEQLLIQERHKELFILIEKYLKEMELNSTMHETVDFVQNGLYRKLAISISKIGIRKRHFVLLIEFSDLSKIAKSDRVASWASMARNMAHEIKNPLMTIALSLGRLEKKLLKDGREKKTEGEKYIDFIRDEVKKMRNTVNQFMRFTSSLEFHFQKCDLKKLLAEVVDIYRKRESQRIAFKIDIAKDLTPVWIDVEQTRNILVNILDNSIDAITGEGEITIDGTEIEKVCEESGHIQNRIEVQISDSGMGIASEHLGKVFEPNFTTKAIGAGFGLSIAKQVMEEQGGEISISSTPDVGTTVTLLFPTAQL